LLVDQAHVILDIGTQTVQDAQQFTGIDSQFLAQFMHAYLS